MSAITPVLPAPLPAGSSSMTALPLYRLSVAQYHAMISAGILQSGDPVELLEGLLVCKMTKHPPHPTATGMTREALEAVLPAGWCVRVQDPITLDTSEPEPDLAVARGRQRDYAAHHPGPADIPLAVEVADSSLDEDRGLKKRVYARNGIAVYWIVNLIDGQIEVYTGPHGSGDAADYATRQDYHPGDTVPVVIAGTEVGRIPVADLLP
jgi:hypothetical protein